MTMNNKPEMMPKISVKDAVDVECEKCGGKVFTQALMLKKVSKFITGEDKDTMLTIPVISCVECHHVNSEFLPKENIY